MTLPEGTYTPEELKWFKNLFDSFYDSIRNYAYFKVGDAAIADDIVQEAFIKVWNMRDEIRSETVKAFLYKIAGNLALNQLKHNQVVYNFENLDNAKHILSIRASAARSAKLDILINNKKVNAAITSKGFSEIIIGDYQLKKGMNTVKILVQSGTVQLDWIKFN